MAHEQARPRVVRCLTVAGSDSSGGAGIQADLKTFAALGVFGMSAITAITAQNTNGISGTLQVPKDMLKAQIEAVLNDLGADAIKVGMLGTKETTETVVELFSRHYSLPAQGLPQDATLRSLPPIVVDSVMVAKGGHPLLDASAIAHLPELLRYARLVTPNIPEALLLLQHLHPSPKTREVTSVQHVRDLAQELLECLRSHHGYTGAVLVKGGHLEEEKRKGGSHLDMTDCPEDTEVVDVLCDSDGSLHEFVSPRINTRNTHGTGCTLSSAIAAELARGRTMQRAVQKAVRYVHGAIVNAPTPDDAIPATALHTQPSAYSLGSGRGPLDHMWKLKPLLGMHPHKSAVVEADFGTELWRSVEEVFEKIIAHPFIQGLTSGNLPEDVFRFYILQDMHYLREYSRCLALLAAKADNSKSMMLFLESAKSIVGGEYTMHSEFCREWGMNVDELPALLNTYPASPTNMLYTSYLLRVAYDRPYYEGVATVLPCAWIYNQVGHYLKAKGSPHPQYARWINTYGGEEFSDTTNSLVEVTSRVASGLGAEQRQRMRECFVQAAKFEFMFWDMAYSQEGYPI